MVGEGLAGVLRSTSLLDYYGPKCMRPEGEWTILLVFVIDAASGSTGAARSMDQWKS